MKLMTNQDAYSTADVIAHYLKQAEMYAAEVEILRQYEDLLSGWRVLDLGVGGGRTTLHLAPRVREYVGADYISEMVEACRKRFSGSPQLLFEVADVRSMPQYEEASFDCVLFSFNGLDYIGMDDRQKGLDEIARILKPGGVFIFSTHNLEHTARMGDFRWTFSLKKLTRRLLRLWRFRQAGGAGLLQKDAAILNDGTFSGRLMTHYIKPEAQRTQLSSRFQQIRCYHPHTGQEAMPPCPDEPWLYWTCVRKSDS